MPTGIYIRTNEQRRKIGERSRGRIHSLETKQKISLAHIGKKFSEEHKRKLSIAHSGKILSEEHKKKISNSLKGRVITPIGKNHPMWKGGISKNPRLYYQRRMSLMRNGGELTLKTIQLVYEDNIKRFGTLTCYLCLRSIEFNKDALEHKIPLSRGGTNEYNNLAIAHRSCNNSKRSKTEIEYLDELKKEK